MNFSIDFNTKKLEDMIMMTRELFLSAIEDLRTTATNEAVVVTNALATMAEVVDSLKSQVASLKLADGVAADFSVESAKLEEVRQAIGAIYEPPAAPVETPVEVAPVVDAPPPLVESVPVAPVAEVVPVVDPVVVDPAAPVVS